MAVLSPNMAGKYHHCSSLPEIPVRSNAVENFVLVLCLCFVHKHIDFSCRPSLHTCTAAIEQTLEHDVE